MSQRKRDNLHRSIRLLLGVAVIFLLYVLVDFSTTENTETESTSYRIELPPLALNQPYFFRVAKRQIVIVRRGPGLNADQYLVAYANGTQFGCPLQPVEDHRLKESCSSAEYDYSGQPVRSSNRDADFSALRIPVYNFCDDFSCINLRM